MKRYFAFALAMALVCICLAPCFAFPASATSDDSSGMEESYATVAAVPMERACFENIIFSQTRSLQLNFGGLDKNNIKLGATCRVTQGSTVLKVNNCTWDSEKTITIDFFNVDGDTDYGVNFSSGYVTSTNITTENVPTGNYAIYVRNIGASKIISGILDYEVTG